MNENPVVYIETTVGEFAVELYPRHAPKTCYNFYELAKMGMITFIIFDYYLICIIQRIL